MSGDGRAGATAPTIGFRPNDAAVRAFHAADDDALWRSMGYERTRFALAAAFPVMLAAWIDGLTDEQLESLDGAANEAHFSWECPQLVRAALTRLGGAHE
jgi:hypothetical protein